MELAGATALITGASSGIGEEFAVELAARGANLVLVARGKDKLDAVRSVLLARHPGVRIEVIAADLSEPHAGADIERQLRGLAISVEILINNAGAGSHGPFVAEAPEKVAAQVQLNCGSLADLTSRFLAPMTRNGRGLIINVASTAAFQPVPTMAVYGATKAFVLSFTEALWWELRNSGVRIIALCPGATETEFFAAAGEQFMTRGRSTPQQVVGAALAAVGTTSPTVVPGAANKLRALGYRVLPRRLMVGMAERSVRAERKR